MSVGEWIDQKVDVTKRIVRRIVAVTVGSVVLVLFVFGGLSLYGFAKPPVREVEKIVEKEVEKIVERVVPEAEKSDEEISREYAQEYDVPWVLVWSVHLHETDEGRWLARYEPKKYAEALRIDRFPEEAKALASSHGPMHMMGLTARSEYDLHSSKLYGPLGWRAGIAYLAKAWHQFKHLPIQTRMDKTLLRYNGGDPTYPGKVYAYLTPMLLEKAL